MVVFVDILLSSNIPRPASGHICLISGDNTNNGDGHTIVIGSSIELAFEVQKLQLMNAHKDETIEYLKQDIARLTEMLELYKRVGRSG